MSDKLKDYIREFYEQLDFETNMYDIKARELRSIQNAVKFVAEKEWDKLSDEEKEIVNNIINITEQW